MIFIAFISTILLFLFLENTCVLLSSLFMLLKTPCSGDMISIAGDEKGYISAVIGLSSQMNMMFLSASRYIYDTTNSLPVVWFYFLSFG